MCDDIDVMASHLQMIQVQFEGAGKNSHEQDGAADKVEKEVQGCH